MERERNMKGKGECEGEGRGKVVVEPIYDGPNTVGIDRLIV